MSKSLAILIVMGIWLCVTFDNWFGTLSDISWFDYWLQFF